jgi:hypothetical protein
MIGGNGTAVVAESRALGDARCGMMNPPVYGELKYT